MALIGFLDESGHSSATEFLALAAFVAEDSSWARFDERWRSALGRHGAPHLHMREFAHRVQAFKGWAEDRRRALLAECVAAINSIRAIGVGAATSVAEFRKLDREGQSRLQDPFFCCFQEVVRGIALNAEFEAQDYKTHMVFSQQDEFRPKATKLWDAMTRYINVRDRMGALEFRDMRAVPALQAADLLAYELRHFYYLRKTKPGAPARWAFREIVHHQRNAYGARMLKYLPGWYLQAQAAGTFDRVTQQMWSDPGRFYSRLAEMLPEVS